MLPGNLVLTMTYDEVGNRTLLTDPDGGRFTYTYDALGRLTAVSNSGTVNRGVATTVSYDPAGNRINYSVTGVATTVSAAATSQPQPGAFTTCVDRDDSGPAEPSPPVN